MGFWAGIKKALNSTVGTPDFEPLDQQIRNNKVLMASEEVYATASTGFSLGLYADPTTNRFLIFTRSIKMENRGSCKIMIDGLNISVSPAAKMIVEIKKNETLVLNRIIDDPGPQSIKSSIITFNRGDILQFNFFLDSSHLTSPVSAQYSALDAKILGTFKESVFKYI